MANGINLQSVMPLLAQALGGGQGTRSQSSNPIGQLLGGLMGGSGGGIGNLLGGLIGGSNDDNGIGSILGGGLGTSFGGLGTSGGFGDSMGLGGFGTGGLTDGLGDLGLNSLSSLSGLSNFSGGFGGGDLLGGLGGDLIGGSDSDSFGNLAGLLGGSTGLSGLTDFLRTVKKDAPTEDKTDAAVSKGEAAAPPPVVGQDKAAAAPAAAPAPADPLGALLAAAPAAAAPAPVPAAAPAPAPAVPGVPAAPAAPGAITQLLPTGIVLSPAAQAFADAGNAAGVVAQIKLEYANVYNNEEFPQWALGQMTGFNVERGDDQDKKNRQLLESTLNNIAVVAVQNATNRKIVEAQIAAAQKQA